LDFVLGDNSADPSHDFINAKRLSESAWQGLHLENHPRRHEVQNMKATQKSVFSLATVFVFVVTTIMLVACVRDTSQDLVKAARTGDTETVRRLLESGADVEAKDEMHHSSVLMWAAHEGHTDVMNLLIQNGAEIDARKPTGETALWFAAQKGQLQTMKILVDHGADIELTGRNDRTAVEVARENGHEEIAVFLEDAGASG